MLDLSVLLPVLAAVLHAVGYFLYNRQTFQGKTKPNPASLFIWLFLAILNAFTFTAMNDWVAALQMFVGSLGMTVTFFYALFAGKLRWPKAGEWAVLIACLLSIVVWKRTDATMANMVIVAGGVLSFAPYIYGLWLDPRLDKAQAWWFFTIAWLTTSVSTYFFHGGLTLSMVMPIAMTVAHLAVALLCLEGRKTSWLKVRREELTRIESEIRQLDGNDLRRLIQQPSTQMNGVILVATGTALRVLIQQKARLTLRKKELEKLGIA
jgi:hypothetical protein